MHPFLRFFQTLQNLSATLLMKPHVKEYFKRYPGSSECFTTQDENIFHNEYDAKAHARNLKNKTVVRIYRTDEAAEETQAVVAPAPTATAVVPTKGINALAPVVVEESGEPVSPRAGEFSTAPIAEPVVVVDGEFGSDTALEPIGYTTSGPVTTDVVETELLSTDPVAAGAAANLDAAANAGPNPAGQYVAVDNIGKPAAEVKAEATEKPAAKPAAKPATGAKKDAAKKATKAS